MWIVDRTSYRHPSRETFPRTRRREPPIDVAVRRSIKALKKEGRILRPSLSAKVHASRPRRKLGEKEAS